MNNSNDTIDGRKPKTILMLSDMCTEWSVTVLVGSGVWLVVNIYC